MNQLTPRRCQHLPGRPAGRVAGRCRAQYPAGDPDDAGARAVRADGRMRVLAWQWARFRAGPRLAGLSHGAGNPVRPVGKYASFGTDCVSEYYFRSGLHKLQSPTISAMSLSRCGATDVFAGSSLAGLYRTTRHRRGHLGQKALPRKTGVHPAPLRFDTVREPVSGHHQDPWGVRRRRVSAVVSTGQIAASQPTRRRTPQGS